MKLTTNEKKIIVLALAWLSKKLEDDKNYIENENFKSKLLEDYKGGVLSLQEKIERSM